MPEFVLPDYSSEVQPAFTDRAACAAWLAELPLVNVAPAQLRLLEQLHALNRHVLAPEERLQILEAMRESVCFVQSEQIKKLASKPLPLTSVENGVFRSVDALWQELLLGYKRCLVATTEGKLKQQIATLGARGLDCVASNMFDHCSVHRDFPAAYWLDLHQFYLAAEAAGESVTAVADAARPGDACCAEIYVRALLFALADTGEQSQRQRTQIQRWLGNWAQHVPVRRTPPAEAGLPPLLIDYATPSGAFRETAAKGRSTRAYLDLGELARILKKHVVLLRKGETPASLGLGEDCAMPGVEQLLVLLFRLWCEGKNARTQTRRSVNAGAKVCGTMVNMHFHVSGNKTFRQPGHATQLSRRERDEIATFGHTSTRLEDARVEAGSYATEDWLLEEESLSGLRILRPAATTGARYLQMQLLAVKPADAKQFLVGMVRWLKTDEENNLHVGMRVFPGMPQAVAIRATGINATKEQFVPALYCPAFAALSVPASLIVPPGWYRPKRVLEVYRQSSELLMLSALLDRGVDFERVAIEAPEKE